VNPAGQAAAAGHGSFRFEPIVNCVSIPPQLCAVSSPSLWKLFPLHAIKEIAVLG
jgi:hypothetical protein